MLASLALFAIVGLYEELVVRGFVLTNIAEGLVGYGSAVAATVAVVASSLLFGAIHLANANASPVAVAGVAVIAITLGVSYVLTGRLGLAVGFHAAWNTAMGVLFGYPVSGFEAPAASLS
ncbi:type II CAAX prenyl endopeptidase Rce1 family protein [Halomicroarcula sp. GCM10025709]|uniref:CPBP family glutamic-type intramembrane protease n=1 Tax=Halomicroarcula sp. GCM10025709 TaxID=3252669 RepID=UPI003608AEB8